MRERVVGTTSESDTLVGATVAGKYVVDEWHAAGGMGVIYFARQQPLDREVALKVLAIRRGEVDPDFERRFYLEAATCAKLSHPNIVVVHDYGRLEPEQGGACFMVMELVHGGTVSAALEEEGAFAPGRAVRIARDIARALRAAHRHGVIHRDLKPANVMLETSDEGERVKVLDFGLVKVLREDAEQITQEGEFLGSPKYMAPEQIAHSDVDARTDLYSLGALLYLLLTGHPPFVRDSSMGTIMAHLEDPVPPMSEHGVEVPPILEEVTRRCLEKSPDDRYQSADELLTALADVWAELAADPTYATYDPWRSTSSTDAMRLRTISAEAMRPDDLVADAQPGQARKAAFGLIGLGVVAVALVAGVAVQERMADPVVPDPVAIATVPEASPTEPEIAPPEPETPAVNAGADDDVAAVPEETHSGTYTLLVESTPPGARLTRDGVTVGQTPIAIELDTSELELEPVMLMLRLPRHYPFAWTQGPLGRDGRIQANLVRENRAQPAARPPTVEAVANDEGIPITADPTVLPWARANPY